MAGWRRRADGADVEPARTLQRQVRVGLGWSFGSNILTRLSTFVAGIVLARILVPTDYGEFTVALVALVILSNLNDLGIEQTLVRWPGDVDRVAPTATTIIAGFSVVLYAGCYLGADAFATALGAPEAAPIVRFIAVGLVINGAFAVPSAMLTRAFRQDRRTVADFTGFIVGTLLTIVLATKGYGAWSFAWGRVVGNTVVSVLHLVMTPQRYRPGWDSKVARELLRTSIPLGGATVVAVLLLNIDYIVVGRLLGTEALGYYTLAFNLASWPVAFFAVSVARVSVPAFARVQHDPARLQSAYDRSSTMLLAATVPTCVLLAVFADPLVRFFYGDTWVPAVTVLHWLAALALCRVLYQFWADVLIAVGASGRVLVTQVCWLVALVPGLVLGSRWGLAGVGVMHVLVALFVVGPVYVVSLRPTLRLGPTLRPAARITAAAVVGGALGVLALQPQWPPFVTLAVGTPAVLLAYALVLRPLLREWGLTRRRVVERLSARRAVTS